MILEEGFHPLLNTPLAGKLNRGKSPLFSYRLKCINAIGALINTKVDWCAVLNPVVNVFVMLSFKSWHPSVWLACFQTNGNFFHIMPPFHEMMYLLVLPSLVS